MLVRKHSMPGELVFDACGCTGPMSLAAINTDRRWVYAESNQENYGIGSANFRQNGRNQPSCLVSFLSGTITWPLATIFSTCRARLNGLRELPHRGHD